MVSSPLDLVGGLLMLFWALPALTRVLSVLIYGINRRKDIYLAIPVLAMSSVGCFVASGALAIAAGVIGDKRLTRASFALLAVSRFGVFGFRSLAHPGCDHTRVVDTEAQITTLVTTLEICEGQLKCRKKWIASFASALSYLAAFVGIIATPSRVGLIVSFSTSVLGDLGAMRLNSGSLFAEAEGKEWRDTLQDALALSLAGDVLILAGIAAQVEASPYLILFGRLLLARWLLDSVRTEQFQHKISSSQGIVHQALDALDSACADTARRRATREQAEPATASATAPIEIDNDPSPRPSGGTFGSPMEKLGCAPKSPSMLESLSPSRRSRSTRRPARPTTTPVNRSDAPPVEAVLFDQDYFAKRDITMAEPSGEDLTAAAALRHKYLMEQEAAVHGRKRSHRRPGDMSTNTSFSSSFSSDNALGLALEGAWPVRAIDINNTDVAIQALSRSSLPTSQGEKSGIAAQLRSAHQAEHDLSSVYPIDRHNEPRRRESVMLGVALTGPGNYFKPERRSSTPNGSGNRRARH